MFYRNPSIRGADRLLVAFIALICLFCASAQAQVQRPPAPPAASPMAPQTAPQQFTQEELKQLVGPIALYPDALIALILPASTVPSDLVLAARFVASKGDQTQVANQPWDDSVKSLVRYPDIVKWMDQNLEWTTQLGEAFLDQPADVMNTIQQLRAQARAAGTLIDTPQQKVVEDQSYIRIVPAEPEVIYVPQYDPEVVFVESYEPYSYGSYEYGYYSSAPYWGPALTFGIGFAVGPWLNFDCDWPRRRVCVGDWNPRWRDDWNPGWRDDWNPEWRRGSKPHRGDFEVRNTVNVVNINGDTARVWEPSPKIQRQHWQRQRSYDTNVSRENFRGRKSEGRDSWRRFSSVAKPSRLGLEGQEGDSDRQGWRRSDRDSSDLVRNSSEFGRRGSRVRDVAPGPQFDQGDAQNSIREGRGRAKRDREMGQDFVRNSSESGRPGSRVRDVTPGPQFDQGGAQNSTREWRGRAKRGQDVRELKAIPKDNSQSFSRQQSRRPSDVQERRFRPDTESVRTNRSSPSPNRSSFRSQQFKHSVSRAESDSGGQIKAKRGSSSSDVKKSQSQRAKVAMSQRSDGSRQAKSSPSRHRASQGNATNYSRSKSSQQSARVEKSGGQSRRPAPSYSRQEGQQASAAGKSRGGGKQSGGKKGNRDSDKNKD